MPSPLREVARLRVIYGDTDQMGVVYYANYLRYFETARNEHLRGEGMPYREIEEREGLKLPVVEAHVDYRRPARYDDELSILAAITEAGGATVRFVYEIRRLPDGELLASGHTSHACVDRSGRAVRVPRSLRRALGLEAPVTAGGPSPVSRR